LNIPCSIYFTDVFLRTCDYKKIISQHDDDHVNNANDTDPKLKSINVNQNTSDHNLAEIGRKGGKKSKLKEELLGLAFYELSLKRGLTALIKMLKNDYDCHNPYAGTDDCYDIYIDGQNLCYTTSNDDNKTLFTSTSVRSLERYFKAAKSQNKK
jgi:hypothetical protein